MTTTRNATQVEIEAEVSHADRNGAASLLVDTLAARILALAETAADAARPAAIELLTFALESQQPDGTGQWSCRTRMRVTLATAPRHRHEIVWSALRRAVAWLTAVLRTNRLSLTGEIELVTTVDPDPAVTKQMVDVGQEVLQRVGHNGRKRS